MIKKGSHLEGVEPINEKIITNRDFLDILENKFELDSSFLSYIKKLLNGRDLYDKSGYSGNSVLIIKSDDLNKDEIVIKISRSGKLYDEYISYKYFYSKNYTSKPLYYSKVKGYEVMITEKIDLPTAGFYFNSYQEIAEFFGKKLRCFHDENLIDKGFTKIERETFEKRFEVSYEEALNNNIPLVYMVDYLLDDDIYKMKRYLKENKKMLYNNLTLVHGDFNPNNVFVTSNYDILMIDFCDSGFCNYHYDIFWTMFMIIIFSGILKDKEKIKECEEIFLNSYGLDKVVEEELLFFKYFACLYWKQHDEITRIYKL